MSDKMIVHDLYLLQVDEKGNKTKTHHRIWDSSLFMIARELEAKALNKKHGTKSARVTLLTEKDFRDATI